MTHKNRNLRMGFTNFLQLPK